MKRNRRGVAIVDFTVLRQHPYEVEPFDLGGCAIGRAARQKSVPASDLRLNDLKPVAVFRKLNVNAVFYEDNGQEDKSARWISTRAQTIFLRLWMRMS